MSTVSVDPWQEIIEPPVFGVPRVEHSIGAGDLYERQPYAPCRCWRCRGVVAAADRPVLDRLLGKHLQRQSETEREAFLGAWIMNPHHSVEGLAQLQGWIRIAGGSPEAEPQYPQVTAR